MAQTQVEPKGSRWNLNKNNLWSIVRLLMIAGLGWLITFILEKTSLLAGQYQTIGWVVIMALLKLFQEFASDESGNLISS